MTRWLQTVTATTILSFILLVSFAGGADPPAPLSQEQRTDIEHRLRALEEHLASTRPLDVADKQALDRWADVDVFRKGVQWALRYDATFTPDDVKLLLKSLDLGLTRHKQLADGTASWCESRGRLARGFVSAIDGSTQPYGLLIPAGYDPAARRLLRLDVVLHGSTRPIGLSELRFLDRFTGTAASSDVDYIELHPLGRVENCYRWAGETDVFEAIDAVCRNYPIDRSRIVLRGMSMGASGTWHLGLKHPDRFVALGPYCGYVDTHRFSRTPLPNFIPVPELPRTQELGLHLLDSVDYAANASVVPVIAAIGEKDIFFDAHVIMRQVFEREGLTMVNLISPGTGHVQEPKTHAEQMRRISEHVERGLEHAQRHIRFVTWSLKYSHCHWLRLFALDQHLQRAEIEAEWSDEGKIDVQRCENIRGFSIDPSRFAKRPILVRINQQSIQVSGDGAIHLVRDAQGWRQVAGDDSVLRSGKRPGLQGPLDDAFCSRFLCVRGTGEPWHSQVQQWVDARLAAFAEEWSHYFRGELPIKRDSEVTEEDVARCHLILFGDPGSNAWIARALATARLPMTWTRDEIRLAGVTAASADHVPVLIQPNPLDKSGEHYVVLNSGHTFGAAELGAVNYLLFPRLGDWAVFQADSSRARKADPRVFVDPTLLDSGYFDENWR